MNISFATKNQILNWNNLVIKNPDGGNIFQSYELSEIKSIQGWKIRYLISSSCALTVYEKSYPFLGRFWYVPKGPSFNTVDSLKKFLEDFKCFAKNNNVFFIKIEPEIIDDGNTKKLMAEADLIPCKPVQSNASTVILDTSPNLDKILQNLPQTSRYSINRAKKDGIITKLVEPSDKNFDIMLSMMKETMSGKKSVMRSDDYYKLFWNKFVKNDMGALFFAYDDKTPIAGAFVMTYGKKATYKDGGSIHKKTIYGASHALQWHIIEWLKSKNISEYDMCGTPKSSEVNNSNHPYYGIGLFKTSFNKHVTDYVGAFDVVISKPKYLFWSKYYSRVVFFLYGKIMKKMYY